jgi:hypothetical protein
MSTEFAAILLAVIGVLGVLAVSYTFYVVGRSEDRERAQAAPPPRAEPEPPPKPAAEEAARPPHGEIARERARKRPPRRPG